MTSSVKLKNKRTVHISLTVLLITAKREVSVTQDFTTSYIAIAGKYEYQSLIKEDSK